jgi:solute carrier family 25 folate transporter 32
MDGNRTSNPRQLALSIPFISGIAAGTLSTLFCNPLDVAKVRIQVQGSMSKENRKYFGTVNTLRLIWREEGIGGLTKGLGLALCTIPLFWGIYWQSYDAGKRILSDAFPQVPTPVVNMFSAVGSGALGNIVVNPFWVVKTRIQSQIFNTIDERNQSIFDIFRKLYVKEGLSSYYKGLNASLLGLSHVAIQFPLYEHLKDTSRKVRQTDEETFIDLVLCSIASKVCACSVTYPHEVLRSRIQNSCSSNSRSLSGQLKTIVRDEGITGLYSGFTTNLIRIVPATMTTFISYEYMSRYLKDSRRYQT